jgi:hypothetical protein
MIWMPATERVVAIVVAEMMVRVPLTEPAQANRNEAKAMMRMPLTKTTSPKVLKQGFEAAAHVAVEQPPQSDDRSMPLDRRLARGGRREGQCADDDGAQQPASRRSKGSHGSPIG